MSLATPSAATRELVGTARHDIGRLDTRADSLVDAGDGPVGALPSLDDRPKAGTRVGRYVIGELLGVGGMGTVFEAYDQALARRVAIKLLHRHQAHQGRIRVRREAQALARLSHPHVVQVHEIGEHDGRPFIAMELVEGISLLRWQSTPRAWPAILEVYAQAGRGLMAAHEAGLVHRDFKPDNCMIDRNGRVRVLDFGLACDVRALVGSRDRTSEPVIDPPTLCRTITRTGSVLGTLAYMAPEQPRGGAADAKSDQFSFCVSLYEALYGQGPFARESIREITQLLLEADPSPPPATSSVPRVVWKILRRGLARDPAARWPSMRVLLERLERVSRLRRNVRWLGAIALGMLSAIGLAHPGSEPPSRRESELEAMFVQASEQGDDARAARAAWQLSEALADRGDDPRAERVWRATAALLAQRQASSEPHGASKLTE
jgi:serine/threonine protein kinase